MRHNQPRSPYTINRDTRIFKQLAGFQPLTIVTKDNAFKTNSYPAEWQNTYSRRECEVFKNRALEVRKVTQYRGYTEVFTVGLKECLLVGKEDFSWRFMIPFQSVYQVVQGENTFGSLNNTCKEDVIFELTNIFLQYGHAIRAIDSLIEAITADLAEVPAGDPNANGLKKLKLDKIARLQMIKTLIQKYRGTLGLDTTYQDLTDSMKESYDFRLPHPDRIGAPDDDKFHPFSIAVNKFVDINGAGNRQTGYYNNIKTAISQGKFYKQDSQSATTKKLDRLKTILAPKATGGNLITNLWGSRNNSPLLSDNDIENFWNNVLPSAGLSPGAGRVIQDNLNNLKNLPSGDTEALGAKKAFALLTKFLITIRDNTDYAWVKDIFYSNGNIDLHILNELFKDKLANTHTSDYIWNINKWCGNDYLCLDGVFDANILVDHLKGKGFGIEDVQKRLFETEVKQTLFNTNHANGTDPNVIPGRLGWFLVGLYISLGSTDKKKHLDTFLSRNKIHNIITGYKKDSGISIEEFIVTQVKFKDSDPKTLVTQALRFVPDAVEHYDYVSFMVAQKVTTFHNENMINEKLFVAPHNFGMMGTSPFDNQYIIEALTPLGTQSNPQGIVPEFRQDQEEEGATFKFRQNAGQNQAKINKEQEQERQRQQQIQQQQRLTSPIPNLEEEGHAFNYRFRRPRQIQQQQQIPQQQPQPVIQARPEPTLPLGSYTLNDDSKTNIKNRIERDIKLEMYAILGESCTTQKGYFDKLESNAIRPYLSQVAKMLQLSGGEEGKLLALYNGFDPNNLTVNNQPFDALDRKSQHNLKILLGFTWSEGSKGTVSMLNSIFGGKPLSDSELLRDMFTVQLGTNNFAKKPNPQTPGLITFEQSGSDILVNGRSILETVLNLEITNEGLPTEELTVTVNNLKIKKLKSQTGAEYETWKRDAIFIENLFNAYGNIYLLNELNKMNGNEQFPRELISLYKTLFGHSNPHFEEQMYATFFSKEMQRIKEMFNDIDAEIESRIATSDNLLNALANNNIEAREELTNTIAQLSTIKGVLGLLKGYYNFNGNHLYLIDESVVIALNALKDIKVSSDDINNGIKNQLNGLVDLIRSFAIQKPQVKSQLTSSIPTITPKCLGFEEPQVKFQIPSAQPVIPNAVGLIENPKVTRVSDNIVYYKGGRDTKEDRGEYFTVPGADPMDYVKSFASQIKTRLENFNKNFPQNKSGFTGNIIAFDPNAKKGAVLNKGDGCACLVLWVVKVPGSPAEPITIKLTQEDISILPDKDTSFLSGRNMLTSTDTPAFEPDGTFNNEKVQFISFNLDDISEKLKIDPSSLKRVDTFNYTDGIGGLKTDYVLKNGRLEPYTASDTFRNSQDLTPLCKDHPANWQDFLIHSCNMNDEATIVSSKHSYANGVKKGENDGRLHVHMALDGHKGNKNKNQDLVKELFDNVFKDELWPNATVRPKSGNEELGGKIYGWRGSAYTISQNVIKISEYADLNWYLQAQQNNQHYTIHLTQSNVTIDKPMGNPQPYSNPQIQMGNGQNQWRKEGDEWVLFEQYVEGEGVNAKTVYQKFSLESGGLMVEIPAVSGNVQEIQRMSIPSGLLKLNGKFYQLPNGYKYQENAIISCISSTLNNFSSKDTLSSFDDGRVYCHIKHGDKLYLVFPNSQELDKDEFDKQIAATAPQTSRPDFQSIQRFNKCSATLPDHKWAAAQIQKEVEEREKLKAEKLKQQQQQSGLKYNQWGKKGDDLVRFEKDVEGVRKFTIDPKTVSVIKIPNGASADTFTTQRIYGEGRFEINGYSFSSNFLTNVASISTNLSTVTIAKNNTLNEIQARYEGSGVFYITDGDDLYVIFGMSTDMLNNKTLLEKASEGVVFSDETPTFKSMNFKNIIPPRSISSQPRPQQIIPQQPSQSPPPPTVGNRNNEGQWVNLNNKITWLERDGNAYKQYSLDPSSFNGSVVLEIPFDSGDKPVNIKLSDGNLVVNNESYALPAGLKYRGELIADYFRTQTPFTPNTTLSGLQNGRAYCHIKNGNKLYLVFPKCELIGINDFNQRTTKASLTTPDFSSIAHLTTQLLNPVVGLNAGLVISKNTQQHKPQVQNNTQVQPQIPQAPARTTSQHNQPPIPQAPKVPVQINTEQVYQNNVAQPKNPNSSRMEIDNFQGGSGTGQLINQPSNQALTTITDTPKNTVISIVKLALNCDDFLSTFNPVEQVKLGKINDNFVMLGKSWEGMIAQSFIEMDPQQLEGGLVDKYVELSSWSRFSSLKESQNISLTSDQYQTLKEKLEEKCRAHVNSFLSCF
jgi:hypothetical protein